MPSDAPRSAARSSGGASGRRGLSRGRMLLIQIAIAVLGLLAIEIVLRIAGFEYHDIPRYIQFADDKYKNPDRDKGIFDVLPDARLFWRLTPSNPRLLTNSHGFRGEDFADRKAPGVVRVVSMGCSCTFGIASSYSYTAALQQFLNENRGGRRYEVVNTGVPGYSSFQGVRLLESEALGYGPDILTVFYGWNDHWLARYFADKDQKTPSRTSLFLVDHASRSRLFQAMLRLNGMIRGSGRKTAALYRVSPEDYRRNLERIIADARKAGVRVALITAPTAYTRPEDVQEYLVDDGFTPDKATALRLHREYNEIVRQVARSEKTLVVDCDSTFEANPQKKMLFGADGIHPNEYGHWLIGMELLRGFVRQGWVDGADYDLEQGAPPLTGQSRP